MFVAFERFLETVADMKFLAPIFALVALTSASTFKLEALSDEEIFYINNLSGANWKAGRNSYPQELGRFTKMSGINITENREYNRKNLAYKTIQVRDDLPENFDPRTKWHDCPSLSEIRDQSNCGSCYIFAAVEALTDRICIKGGGQVHLSAEDPLECCSNCGNGCSGGVLGAVYNWYVSDGIVTGGQYGSNEGCKPYSLPFCDHDQPVKYPECGNEAPTPSCQQACRSGYSTAYTDDKRKGSSTYKVSGEQQIMQELVDNGPVSTIFELFVDFGSYKSGVYRHIMGQGVGYHAVKILGYGVENGEKYWLVANSWNEDWGDNGYFKILRGSDECKIEENVVAGEPQI